MVGTFLTGTIEQKDFIMDQLLTLLESLTPMHYMTVLIIGCVATAIGFKLVEALPFNISNQPVFEIQNLGYNIPNPVKQEDFQFKRVEQIGLGVALFVAAGLAIFREGLGFVGLAYALLFVTLVLITAINLKHDLFPDSLTLPLMWAGLIFHQMNGADLSLYLYGAVFGYLCFWVPNFIYRLAKGHDWVGYGNMKMMAALGAWFGSDRLAELVLIVSVVGIIGFIPLMMNKNSNKMLSTGIPFMAAALAVYLSNKIF